MKPRTLDELAEDLKQGRPPSPEAWVEARRYERSLLPTGLAWPAEGDEYVCTEDHLTRFTTHWHVPFTGGGQGMLLHGDRIQIAALDEPEPIFVAARPVDNAMVQPRLIPPADLRHPNYAGFSLSIRIRDLLAKFRRIA